MRVHLLVVGTRPAGWVREGFETYARRLGAGWRLNLIEVAAGGRSGHGARDQEAERLLKALPRGARLVTLDPGGRTMTTEAVAERLGAWQHEGRDLALAVGGADGLGPTVHDAAEHSWSLSALTFPHQLVRVIVAEQIYRAWTVLNAHPYHRG